MRAGPKDSVVKLRVRDPNNKEGDVELKRTVAPNDRKYYAAMDRTGLVMKLLPARLRRQKNLKQK
jgi:hypothetical protein